jgi:enoyl-CoA hydratase
VSIDVERDGRIATVVVNRPEALNAIDLEHAQGLRDRLEELAGDETTRVVILTGAGDKAFIAGADIKYMQAIGTLEARRWGELGHDCGRLLETMPKPTIAAINGYALGGGLELALACDLRLASSTATLGQPEIDLGILPGWGGSIRLARTTNLGFAKAMIFTGRSIGADHALEHGLVNVVHPPEELIQEARALAEGLAAKSALALAYAKEATNLALQGPHRANLEAEARLFAMMFSSEDQKEGMAAFVEKRKPRFSGR